MLVFEDFRSRLYKALTKAIPGLDNKDLLLDSSGHGDFTIRLFRIVKDMKTTPDKIFSIVRDELSSEDYIDKMELVGSYINFSIKPERMFAVISESLARTGQYPDIFQDPERILVEHTSANPTGPLHVGRVRGSIIGDSLAKLLTRYGYRVSTQYYINDSGKQMIALYEGFLRYGKNSMTVGSLLKGYQDIYREMESDKSIAAELEKIIVAYESGDRSIIMKIREIASVMLQDIRDSLMQLDIKIDDYVWESDFLLGGDVDNVMHELSDSLEDEDGARFITTDEGNKVFLRRKDGTSLYFVRDIAYHMFKSLNFDWFIDVLGEAHKDHGKNLTYVLKELLELDQRLDFLYYGFVSLESGKMSTRMGKIVSLWDLISRTEEEALSIVTEKRKDLSGDKLVEISRKVARSSIRFNIIRVNPVKTMVFRWNEALNFEGDSAPYIMYSYTRASSILEKTTESVNPVLEFTDERERNLVRSMYMYPYYLEEATKSMRSDIISSYTLGLVKSFNDFYSQCQVLNALETDRNRRVAIVKMYREILDDACRIIGIKNVDEM
ncbi:MAG: arginine--tRNA ligase [Thermoplasmatales archaeon B_DKE]|nr:MAG: arginine--tRNA ligase [Thermoplasmatales archaeon B_DKE]